MNVEGMRHAEVVAFIKRGGDETRLLVVDPDTDHHFKKMGVTPLASHVKGRPTPCLSVKQNIHFKCTLINHAKGTVQLGTSL